MLMYMTSVNLQEWRSEKRKHRHMDCTEMPGVIRLEISSPHSKHVKDEDKNESDVTDTRKTANESNDDNLQLWKCAEELENAKQSQQAQHCQHRSRAWKKLPTTTIQSNTFHPCKPL